MKQFLKKAKDWLFIRKQDVRSEQELKLYYPKRIVLLLLAFIVLTIVVALAFINFWREGEVVVSVPDVRQQPLMRALLMLQKKNLRYRIKTVIAHDQPAGIVVDQQPKGGFFTRELRTVKLFISQPSGPGNTPNLIGKTLAEAEMHLKRINTTNFQIRLGKQAYTFSDQVAAGRIVSQNPNPGARAQSPILIDLLISKGREGYEVVLPNFTRQSVDKALRWLAMNNVAFRQTAMPGEPEGKIVAQNPAAGETISHGGVVTLSIGGSARYGVFNYVFPNELKLSQANLRNESGLSNEETIRAEDATNQAMARKRREQLERRRRRQEALIKKGVDRFKVQLIKTENNKSETIFRGSKAPGERMIASFKYKSPVKLEMIVEGQKFITRTYQ